MSDQERDVGGSDIDLTAALAGVRAGIASLGDEVESLRDQADALLERASARTTLALLEPPHDEELDAADVALLDAAHQVGRHAADVPEVFDPRPYDPEEDDGDDEAELTEPAFQDLAAAPAFEPESSESAQIPAFEVPKGATPLEDADPAPVLADDRDDPVVGDVGDVGDVAEGDEADEHVADVIEFTPRNATPAPADPEPDAEPAFGFLSSELGAPDAATSDDRSGSLPDDVARAFGDLPPEPSVDEIAARATEVDQPTAAAGDGDGLDAIAESESTDVPPDWDGPSPDDDAFDKFFSSDVEPEPAQRWLLNE